MAENRLAGAEAVGQRPFGEAWKIFLPMRLSALMPEIFANEGFTYFTVPSVPATSMPSWTELRMASSSPLMFLISINCCFSSRMVSISPAAVPSMTVAPAGLLASSFSRTSLRPVASMKMSTSGRARSAVKSVVAKTPSWRASKAPGALGSISATPRMVTFFVVFRVRYTTVPPLPRPMIATLDTVQLLCSNYYK